MAWNFVRWCILTTFRTDKFMVMVCWFFKFCHYFGLVKQVKFGVSKHFLENAWREWSEIFHATVSSPTAELIRLWSRSGDFLKFWCYFNLVKQVKFGISGDFLENSWKEWPEILHTDGQGLLIFLILALFWHSKMGQIWVFRSFPGEPIEEMVWHFACCILTTFRTDHSLLIYLILHYFDLVKWVKFGFSGIFVMLYGFPSLWCPFNWNWLYLGFLGIIWRTCGSKWRRGSGGIFPMLCFQFCQVYLALSPLIFSPKLLFQFTWSPF